MLDKQKSENCSKFPNTAHENNMAPEKLEV